MKNTFLIMLLSLVLVSCGGPGSGGESLPNTLNTSESDTGITFEFEEIRLDFDGTNLNNIPTSVSLLVDEDNSVVQRIAITNFQRPEDISIAINDTAVSGMAGVSVSNNCGATLGKFKRCVIEISLNKNFNQSAANLGSQTLGITIGGSLFNVTVQGEVTPGADENAQAQAGLNFSTATLDYGTLAEGSQSDQVLIVQNTTRSSLPVSVNLAGATSFTQVFNTCGATLSRFKFCYMIFRNSGSLATGTYNESISIASNSIGLDLIVDPAPVVTQNNAVTYVNPPAGNLISLDGLTSNYNYQISNETLGTQTLYYDFTPDGTGYEYPEAVSLDDTCLGSVGKLRDCNINISFEADRYHFGQTFSKQISFNDEILTLEFTGTSPCSDPGDILYSPGTKLSPDKTSCVPNLGSFDHPDTLFGYAVFQ